MPGVRSPLSSSGMESMVMQCTIAQTVEQHEHGVHAGTANHFKLTWFLYGCSALQLSTEAEGPETNGRAPPALGCTNSMAGSGSDSEVSVA
eukprot:1139836-Pelagomonas_calceolata.AAC.4